MSRFDEPMPDGVYLNLPAKDYFGQETRGSSDWARIHRNGWGWWWGSRYNPDYVEGKNPYQNYGSALHALLLEGPQAFERDFAVAPDPRDFPELVTTEKEIRAALSTHGVDLTGTSKFKKDDWNRAMRDHLWDVPCWDNIMTDFLDGIGERATVSAMEARMLRFMREVAVSDTRVDNAVVRKLLADDENPALAEVTIFSTIDGIRRRWRIDRMYRGADMDLKSLGNWRGRPLRWEVGDVLARNNWDIQRADYFEGRTEAYNLIRQGKLFGGDVEQRRFIRSIVEEEETWDWVWLVYQKPELSGRAPILFPVWDSSWRMVDDGAGGLMRVPGELRQYGLNKLNKAIAFYREAVAEFGLDKPWAHVETLHFTTEPHVPMIYLPHWIADDEPIEAAAYQGEETESEAP